eukprot:CAMPEP_0198643900 /NCGR_PEP_ID=MMETSP1467-20131203/232_1 /TAXON_ID=1462469 /ORGANISM="unid. sp., Strain CCMP2135" /LENGTH=169 /DNA_ID=CAMNT_0044379329 /DNA_START=13 /DNA_END=522 /DNA_ORIENTATION=+
MTARMMLWTLLSLLVSATAFTALSGARLASPVRSSLWEPEEEVLPDVKEAWVKHMISSMETKLQREQRGVPTAPAPRDAKKIAGRTESRQASLSDVTATIELTEQAAPDKEKEDVSANYFLKMGGFVEDDNASSPAETTPATPPPATAPAPPTALTGAYDDLLKNAQRN